MDCPPLLAAQLAHSDAALAVVALAPTGAALGSTLGTARIELPEPDFGALRHNATGPRSAPPVSLGKVALAQIASDQPEPHVSVLPKPAFGAEKTAFDGDFLIVGVGMVVMPNFEGSSQQSTVLAGAFSGHFRGIGISPRAAGFGLDLIPDRTGARVGIGFGPVFRLRMNRAGRIKDPVVASLGKLRSIIEGGFNLGITIKRPFNGHDQLSLGSDFRWDISGRGGGGVISPTVSYLSPISKAQVVGILASAEFANKQYARYNYDISPAGSASSGLPVFTARGGLKSVNFAMFTARDLDGNLRNGGFSIGAGVMYSRLKGSAASTPITVQRGRASQWTFAAGLGFTL